MIIFDTIVLNNNLGYTPLPILNPSKETGKILQEKNSQINP